jgi:hypothetical protein
MFEFRVDNWDQLRGQFKKLSLCTIVSGTGVPGGKTSTPGETYVPVVIMIRRYPLGTASSFQNNPTCHGFYYD